MRALWVRIGLGTALVTALLPVLVALLHLLPAVLHAEPEAHHQHALHAQADPLLAEANVKTSQAPDAPRREPTQTAGHCPLCFWLQGFHALPAPEAIAAPVANAAVMALLWHEPAFVAIRLSITAQPRAPPVPLPA